MALDPFEPLTTRGFTVRLQPKGSLAIDSTTNASPPPSKPQEIRSVCFFEYSDPEVGDELISFCAIVHFYATPRLVTGIYNASKDEFLMRPLEAAYHGTALDGSSWDTLTAEDKDVFIDNDMNTQNKDKLREEIKASLRSLRLLRE